jgi:hypothetical protein
MDPKYEAARTACADELAALFSGLIEPDLLALVKTALKNAYAAGHVNGREAAMAGFVALAAK